MESDQLQKQLEWMDSERRRDRATIASLEQRLAVLEGLIPGLGQQIKEQRGDLARASAQLSRFDEIEGSLVQIRTEQARSIEAIEKQSIEHDREAEKTRRADLEGLNKAIADVRKTLEVLPEIKRNLQSRMEEEYRLGRLIEEVDKKVKEAARSDEEYQRSLKLIDEGRRQDSKRVTDMTGEVAALRKRVDEQRGKIDVTADSVRKIDLRLGEFQATDIERRQTITSFIEKQTMLVVERDRVWKEMQVRFESLGNQSANLDTQLQSLDALQRSVKRSQEGFDDITIRIERRMNEITEMQRLVEERFRQEWVSFKSDDQKRWTNYSLAHEEQQHEVTRQFEKYNERLQLLEDMSQELRDQSHSVVEETQKRLQSLLSQVHTWVEDYDRAFRHGG